MKPSKPKRVRPTVAGMHALTQERDDHKRRADGAISQARRKHRRLDRILFEIHKAPFWPWVSKKRIQAIALGKDEGEDLVAI